MPSGAKKRKAAKKKMVKEANNSNSQGDNDKHNDARENDGDSTQKSEEGVNNKEDYMQKGVFQTNKELKPLEDQKGKIVIVEHAKESNDSSSGSSNRGSSDDEPDVLEKKITIDETAPPVDSIKTVDSSSTVVTQISDNIPAREVNHLVEENVSVVDSAKVLSVEKPQVASAPQTVQTTSWKSCCGIFELFTGSNR